MSAVSTTAGTPTASTRIITAMASCTEFSVMWMKPHSK